MQLYTFLGLTFTVVGFSAAQSTIVSLFLPNTDPQSLVASVIGVDATATTYLISCPPGTDANNCGYGGGATVVEGPATLQYMIAGESIACNLAGTTQAVCTQSQTLSGYSTTQLVTSTLGPADITYFPVGVTAGAEKLRPATTSVSASATSTIGSGSTGSITPTGIVGSISVAVGSDSASGPATSMSTTGMVSSSSASMSVPSSEVSSSRSQTQTASAATASASSGASTTGRVESPFVAEVMGCLLGVALAISLL